MRANHVLKRAHQLYESGLAIRMTLLPKPDGNVTRGTLVPAQGVTSAAALRHPFAATDTLALAQGHHLGCLVSALRHLLACRGQLDTRLQSAQGMAPLASGQGCSPKPVCRNDALW